MKFRKYQESDIDQVVNLLNCCFPNQHITKSSFYWKHFDSFFQNKTIAYVAVANEKIVSFVCFTPVDIANQTQQFYSCAVQATHPNHRKQGLVTKLTLMIESELGPKIQYLGFSNQAGVNIDKYSQKISYQIIGQLKICHLLSLPSKTNIQIRRVPNIPKPQSPKLHTINKTKDYLRWRYQNHPKHKYRYFVIIKNQKEIGYIICQAKLIKYEVKEIILNHHTKNLYQQTIKAFTNYALRHLKLTTTYTFLENNFWLNFFPKTSLIKNINIYLTLKTKSKNLLNPNNWLIQGGDVQ